jgi:N-formylglutamate deformylase
VELVRAYADPVRERHSIQLEVNRALYMDESSLALRPRYQAVKNDLQRVLGVALAAMRERLSARVPA